MPYSFKTLPPWHEVESEIRSRGYGDAEVEQARQRYWTDLSGADDFQALGPERGEAIRSRLFNEPITPVPGGSRQPEGPATSPAELYGRAPLSASPVPTSAASTPSELYGSLKPRLASAHQPEPESGKGWIEAAPDPTERMVYAPSSPRRIPWQEQELVNIPLPDTPAPPPWGAGSPSEWAAGLAQQPPGVLAQYPATPWIPAEDRPPSHDEIGPLRAMLEAAQGGYHQMGGSMYQAAEALTALPGRNAVSEWLGRAADAGYDLAAEHTPAMTGQEVLADPSAGNVARWALTQAAAQVPQMGTTAAMAAATGGSSVAGQALRPLAPALYRELVARLPQLAAIIAPTALQEAGEIRNMQLEGGVDDPARALTSGLAAGSLEAVFGPEARLGREIAGTAGRKSLRAALKELGREALLDEPLTEALQTLTEYSGAGQDPLSEKATVDMAEAAAAAVPATLGFGGGGMAVSRGVNAERQRRAEENATRARALAAMNPNFAQLIAVPPDGAMLSPESYAPPVTVSEKPQPPLYLIRTNRDLGPVEIVEERDRGRVLVRDRAGKDRSVFRKQLEEYRPPEEPPDAPPVAPQGPPPQGPPPQAPPAPPVVEAPPAAPAPVAPQLAYYGVKGRPEWGPVVITDDSDRSAVEVQPVSGGAPRRVGRKAIEPWTGEVPALAAPPVEPPAEQPAATVTQTVNTSEQVPTVSRPDRRQDTEMRAALAAMNPEDMTPEQRIEAIRLHREELRTDQLTKILNRRAWDEDRASTSEPRGHGALDLDDFKKFQDQTGEPDHQAGDQVLVGVASRLREVGQKHGVTIYRTGGDEFSAIGPTTEHVQAALTEAYESLQKDRVGATLRSGVRVESPVLFSFGVGKNPEEADAAAGRAKAERKRAAGSATETGRGPGRVAPAVEPGLRSGEGGVPPGTGPAEEVASGEDFSARSKYPDGRLVPQVGDEVYQMVAGFGGTAAYIHGKVVGNKNRTYVVVTGSAAMVGEAQKGKKHKLTPQWTVRNDPEIARREAEREAKRVAEKAESDAAQSQYEERTASSIADARASGAEMLSGVTPTLGMRIVSHFGGVQRSGTITNIDDAGRPYAVFDDENGGQPYDIAGVSAGQEAPGGFLGNDLSTYTVEPAPAPTAPVTPEPLPTITFPDLMARVARATTPEELDTLQRTAETTATTNGQRMMAESQKFQAAMKVARERVARPEKQGAAGEVAGTVTPSRTAKIVDRLRKLAAGMDATIADKRRPTTQNMTPRRARMESSRFDDANRLESIQTLMLRIADAMEAGTLAQPLRDIDLSNRAVIEQLHSAATHKTKSGAAYYHESHLKDWLRDSEGLRGVKDERAIVNRLLARRGEHGSRTYDPKDIAAIHRLVDAIKKAGKRVFFQIPSEEVVVRAGVRSDEQWVQVRDAIAELIAPKKESEADRVRKLERELVGVKIPGFFPTPRPVIDRMLEEADIQPGQSVLEPSAGKGDIADAIREHGVTPDTIEYSDTLAKVLEAKGYTPKVADFLEQTGQYDRVVMNPPFEQGQDIDHVRHAFTMLKPGGRLVAIMSEGPFFRSDKKATEFREWLDSVNGTSEQLPAGSFTGAEAFRQTGAATRLVVIEKPEAVVSSTAGSSENRHVAAYDSRVSRNMASDAYSRVPLGPHSREILSRIGPFIPEDILPGSGAADGWIYGWLGAERGDTSPRDMGMGGGVYSSTVRGFNAYYEQHQPAIGETGTPDEIVAALESLPQPGGLSRPEGISLLQKLGFAVEPTVRRANSEDVGRLYLMLKRKEITRQEYQAGIRNSYDTNGNPLGSEPVTPKPTGIPGQLPEPLATIRREFKRTTPAAQEHFDALIRERDALSSRIEKIREPEAEANRVAGDMQKRARRSGSQKQWRAYEKLRDAVIAESHRVQGLVKPLVERRNDIEEQMYRWHLENAAESGDPLRSIPALVKLAEDMGRDERGAYSAGKKELASIIRAHLLDEGYTPEEIGTEDEYAADSALEQPASRDNENKVQLARSRIVGVMQNRLADRIRTEGRFLEAAVADDYGPGAVPKSGIYSRREAVKNASRMPSTLEQVRAATADMDALVEIGRAVFERKEAESRREQAELTAIRERLEGRVIDPTPEETAEVAAGSKKTDTTGFTPKQKEYIAEKLEEVYPELPDGPIGRGLAINVPGDGQIRVNSKEGADRLHKTLAKEPIGDVEVDRLRPIPDFSLGSELPAAALEDWERAVNPGDPGAAKALLRELLSALEASGQGDSAKANRVRTLLGIAGKRAEKPGVVQVYDDAGNPLKVIKGEPIPIPGFEGIEFVLVKERAGFVLYEKSSGLSAYSYPGARDREEFVAAAIASLQKLGRPTVEQAIADGIAKRQGVAHQTVDQTETPEFRRWFGDSRVVDADGKPVVVYHSGSFDERDDPVPVVGKDGFHFGTRQAAMERPAGKLVDDEIRSLVVEQEDGRWFWRTESYDSFEERDEEGFDTEEEARRDGEQFAAEQGDWAAQTMEEEPPLTAAYLSIQNPMRVRDQKGDWTAAIRKAKRLGHDGIVYRNEYEDRGQDSYIAFRPEQIKSATGNRGTFDPTNPDVRYQTGQPATPVTLTADTLREHFPGAKVSDVEGGYELRLPGQEPITVREVNRIQPDADALAQHGQTLEDVRAGRVLITAAYVPGGLSGQDVVMLARNRWDATSIPHERMHMAFRLALTEKERAALIKKFGSEEGAATAAESWTPGQGGLFHKVYLFFRRLAQAIFGPQWENVFADVASGDVWTRERKAEPGRLEYEAAQARELAPPWYSKLQRTLEEKLPARSLDITPAMRDSVLYEGQPLFQTRRAPKDESPRAPWEVPDETRFQKIRRKAQDKFLRFAKTQEAIEGQTGETITDEQDVALATELRRSRAGNRLEKMEVAHVKPIALLVRQLGKAGVSWKQVNEWLYARHAGERNAALMQDRIDEADRRGTPLDLDDPEVQASISGLSGMSNEEAREVLAQYTGARQALLEQLGAKVDALTRAKLAWMVEDGLLTQEAVDAMQARYQHYVPLKGISGEEDIAEALGGDEGPRMHTGRGLDVRGVEVRRAKGRHSRATHDIISQLVMDAEESVVRGEKNRVGETLGRLMKEFPNSEAWEFYRPRRSVKVGPGGRVYSIPATWEADRETLVVAYKDRGRQVFVRFKDPLMARAYKNLGPVNLPKFMELVAKTTRFYAAVRTQINPEWWITNFMRDFQEASINLSTEDARGMGREVRRNTFRAIAGILGAETGAKWQAQWQRYFSEYQEDGAQVRFLDFRNLESQQDRLMRMAHAEGNAAWLATKEAAQTIGDVISGFNLAIENGVRLAAYVAARNRGMSRARAAAMAKNLTVNFEKHGEWGPTVSSLWAFANANVQGPARMMMALSSPRVWKIMGAMASLAAAVAMYGALYGGEDDEDGRRYWDKIPTATKERFLPLLIPGTKGKYIPIPMPYGYSWPMVASFALVDDILLPKLAPTPTHQKVDPLRAAFNTMAGVANSFNPLGGLSTETGAQLAISAIPSVGQPFARAAINEDQFGRQIAPSGIPFGPQQPDSSKAWASTPQWARKTAAALNAATGGNAHRSGKLDFSPDSLEYIMDEAVGGLGKFVHGAAETSVALATGATPELRKVPFARKAVATVGDYAVSREYRDAINEIETLRAELKDAVGPAREAFLRKHRPVLALSDAAKAFEKELDTLRKAHKDRPSDELKRRMTSLQKRFLKRYLTATQTAD